MLQQAFGDRPALVHLADQIARRHLHVFQEGFAEHRRAGNQADRSWPHAGVCHVDQQEGNAVMLAHGRVGADKTEDPVGVMRVAGPDLVTVDQVMIALQHRASLQPRQIGPGSRFAVALAPADFSTHDLRQMLLALRLGAVFQQHRPQHRQPHAAQRRAAIQRLHFLIHHRGFHLSEATAAVLLRPGRRGPALFRHAVEPDLLFGILVHRGLAAGDDFVVRHRRAHQGRTVRLEPASNADTKIIQFGHVGLP